MSNENVNEVRARAEPYYRRQALRQRYTLIRQKYELIEALELVEQLKEQVSSRDIRICRLTAAESEARGLVEHLAQDVMHLGEMVHQQAARVQGSEEEVLRLRDQLSAIPATCRGVGGCLCGGITDIEIELQKIRTWTEEEEQDWNNERPRTDALPRGDEMLGPTPGAASTAPETLAAPPVGPPSDHVPQSPASPEYVPLDGTIPDAALMPPPSHPPIRRGCPRIQYHPLVAHGEEDEAVFEALGGYEPWE